MSKVRAANSSSGQVTTDSIIHSSKHSFSGSFATDENQNLNHNCMWRKSYEEEHQKRIEAENTYISILKKLETTRDTRIDMESEIKALKERVLFLEMRNSQLENETSHGDRASEIKRSTMGLSDIAEEPCDYKNVQSPIVVIKNQSSKSPNRITMPDKPIRKVGDNIDMPLQMNSKPKLSNPVQDKRRSRQNIMMHNVETGHKTLEDNLKQIHISQVNVPFGSNLMRSSLEQQLMTTMASESGRNSNERFSRQKRSVKFSQGDGSQMSSHHTDRFIPAQQLSIDYRDNDPQFYQDDNQPEKEMINKQKHAFRKIKSGDNFGFVDTIRESFPQQDLIQSQIDQTKISNNIERNSLFQAPQKYQVCEEMEEVKEILKPYRKQNLGFSQIKIMELTEEGKFQRIKLKKDYIIIAQKEFQQKYRKQKEHSRKDKVIAKSMQFNQNELMRPKLHQIQPSLMLSKEHFFDNKYHNLKLENQYDYDEANLEQEKEDLQSDWQESNYTSNQQNTDNQRLQVQYSNHEVMTFESPRQGRQYQNLQGEDFVQTHRIIDDDFEDQMLLETPVHRIGTSNCSKEYDTFRAKQKGEYSNDQIKEMQMSIRNISTNKKTGRKQMGGKVMTNKMEKKHIESFRAYNIIKEEPPATFSDEEQEINDQQDKSASMGGINNLSTEHRLIKNPTYTRITHASKQMGFPGPSRLGGTIGFRNEFNQLNPLMKSMPNLDFLKSKDKSSSMHFDEISGIGADGGLQHSSTLFDLNNTYIHPQKNDKLIGFGSPQLNKAKGSQVFSHSPPKGTKSSKIFDEFFIIGVENEDIAKLDWSKTDHQYTQPKTLYLYNQDLTNDCERRRVVKDFCFPDGIEIRQLKKAGDSRHSINSKAQKILYSSKSVREQCFVFIMNANDEAVSDNSFSQTNPYLETFPGGGTLDKYYNCICVVFNELVSPDQPFNHLKGKELDKKFRDSKVYSTKKAYCFMFVNSFYQLHLDVINLMINALKYERLKISSHLIGQDPSLMDQTYTDILSMLDLPLISPDMKRILNKYYNLEQEDKNTEGQQIFLNVGEEIGFIKYDIPPYIESTYLDCSWFCPTLFSLFSVPTLFKLISAVLLEKSLVFIGKQSLLSSAILGLNSLIYPFKWCLALVPILPHPLIEMLEAPLPILVGITKREYKEITLTQHEKDSKIWVFLENGEVVWNNDGEHIPEFNFGNVPEIEYEHSNFRKVFDGIYTQDSGLDSERSSAYSDVDTSQIYNDEIKYNCRTICELIRKSLKNHILDSLKKAVKRQSHSKIENFVNEIGDLVVRNGRTNDKAFLEQFVETQMFTTYIEENMKTISNFNILK